MHFKTVTGSEVKSMKIRDFKIRSVDGFGLAEQASSVTVLKLSYSQFREKSWRGLREREWAEGVPRQLLDVFSGLRG